MSPELFEDDRGVSGFPRVSGDEPGWLDCCGSTVTFSPRERG